MIRSFEDIKPLQRLPNLQVLDCSACKDTFPLTQINGYQLLLPDHVMERNVGCHIYVLCPSCWLPPSGALANWEPDHF